MGVHAGTGLTIGGLLSGRGLTNKGWQLGVEAAKDLPQLAVQVQEVNAAVTGTPIVGEAAGVTGILIVGGAAGITVGFGSNG